MLRRHLNAATIIALVALVFAMTGGAFAVATKGGGSSAAVAAKKKKKRPAKVTLIPGPAGKEGKQGQQGPQGPEGKAGASGKDGINGTNGLPGESGKNGATGKSVVVETEPAKTSNCEGRGGSTFHEEGSAVKHYACNGKEGSPWTPGTLPSGRTETGEWSVYARDAAGGEEFMTTAISFPIPLAVAPKNVEEITEKETANCPGGVQKPEALPGYLCLFEGKSAVFAGGLLIVAVGDASSAGLAPGTNGAELILGTSSSTAAGTVVSSEGTWAVTAE